MDLSQTDQKQIGLSLLELWSPKVALILRASNTNPSFRKSTYSPS
ncbi:unnamed protein product [Acidithrix sp. C25]|nr:unnamed protein product [Acidithrix sp. C25]